MIDFDLLCFVYNTNSKKDIADKTGYSLDVINGVSDYFFHGMISDKRFCHVFLSEVKDSIVQKFQDS